MLKVHRRRWKGHRGSGFKVPAIALAAVLMSAGIAPAGGGEVAQPPTHVKHVDLVHFSHTDYGFTDHPAVCRELQVRFLDIALDAALATRDKPPEARFAWTAETTVAVLDWWNAAPAARREALLGAVASGQLEISALPLNNTPFLDGAQWRTMVQWLPEDLWAKLRPKVAIQNDVNGMPRAGAVALLDRGVRYLFSGINEDSGGAPLARPCAFWWKMPDGRRMFVYLNFSYPMGYWFFEPVEWRRGPVPRAGDTRYRPPRAGEFLRTDEASLRGAQQRLWKMIGGLESAGFRYPTLVLSITNQWRIDNDPPLLFLPDFVAAWNRLGLKPSVRLTTASVAMERLEREIGHQVAEYAGEWTDWWANGTASAPREVAASREAKRLIAAAESSLWGELTANARRTIDELRKELCLFDEHTWGSSNSVAVPYRLDTQAQFNEKAGLAFRPMARAEWLLAQRVRSRLSQAPEGLYVANSSKLPWSGWVEIPATALRDDFRCVEDPKAGTRQKIVFEPGLRPFRPPASPSEVSPENTAATFPDLAPRQVARFWVENLPGRSIAHWRLSTEEPSAPPLPRSTLRPVATDASGWPTSLAWEGMSKPLASAGLGDFLTVSVKGFAPRWRARAIWYARFEQREALRKKLLETVAAHPEGRAAVADNPHTVVFSQRLRHPRVQWAVRRLEVWKREPRARLTFRLNRISSEAPEAMFIAFTLPCEGTMPRTSCGGLAFVPFRDQLPGTCRDYFAIDGWVYYPTPEGHWLWVSRDAPLVTFSEPQVLARRTEPPSAMHRVLAMVFNNFWYTNFVGDSHGVMEFQFDLGWRQRLEPAAAADLADTFVAEPQVLIQPGLPEDPIFVDRLYTP